MPNCAATASTAAVSDAPRELADAGAGSSGAPDGTQLTQKPTSRRSRRAAVITNGILPHECPSSINGYRDRNRRLDDNGTHLPAIERHRTHRGTAQLQRAVF